MLKKISKIFIKLLVLIDKFLISFFDKRNFLVFFKDELEKKTIFKHFIFNKEIKFFCPNQTCYWRYKSWITREPDTIEWINNFRNDKSIFWDIGANIGQFSLYSSLKHPSLKVFSFEPSTSNLRVLSRNIFLNNLGNKIKIFPIGVTDNNKFSIMKENNFVEGAALNNLSDTIDGVNEKHAYSTFSMSLNYLIEKSILKCPNYIKIDVDGLEEKIIFNSNLILKNKELRSILIELSDEVEENFEIVNYIQNFGFEMKSFNFPSQQREFKNFKNYIFERKK